MLGFQRTSPIWYDDTGHWRVVKHFAETGQLCYPLDGQGENCDPESMFITLGPAVQVPASIWMKIFGTSMATARAFILPFSLLLLGIFLALARELTGKKKALWAGLLIAGNIQLLTYGSQFLGEVPMLFWLFLGLWFQVRWLKGGEGQANHFLGALVGFLTALACKESILMPLGAGMLLFMVTSLFRRDWAKAVGVAFQGILLGLAWVALIYSRVLEGKDFWDFWELRSGYGKEFFALEFTESLRFLLFKPLIWLGMAALLLKMQVRRDPRDWFLGLVFLAQLIFFLLSRGYDRFGFQLIFIPAIYLSEFVVFAVDWIQKKKNMRLLWQVGGIIVFLVVFTQQSFPLLAQRLLDPASVNAGEKCLGEELNRLGILDVFTYDEQIVTFLPSGANYRLEPMVHVNADLCKPLELRLGEYLVAGEYARTEFPNCVNWPQLEQVGSCGEGAQRYEIFGIKGN